MLLKFLSTKKLISGLFLILLFFTPLIYVTNTHEMYEFPKMFFVYIIGATIIFLFALSKILNPSPVKIGNIFVLLLVLSFVISTVFSTHIYTSVWGYYSRFNGGLISVLIFFGLYVVAINTFPHEQKESILKLALLSMVLVAAFAIYQHFHGELRAFSTFGQPNWLAAYLIMLIPSALYFSLQKSKEKLFWIFVFLLGFTGLWFTYSISGLLGFVLGILFFGFLNFPLVKQNLKQILFLFVAILIISFLNLGTFDKRIHDVFIDVKNFITYQVTVYAQDAYDLSDPGFIRTGIWRGTLNLIFSNPKIFFIGTGPETFPYEFPKFRIPSLNYSSEWDFILNKPHNYYLELWSQVGLAGLVIYLFVIKGSLKSKNTYLAPGLLAFYVSNFFGWPSVATSLLFWLFLAFLYGEDSKRLSVSSFSHLSSKKNKAVSLVLACIFAIIYIPSIYKFVNVYAADIAFSKADSALTVGETNKSLDFINSAISKNGDEPIYYRWRAKVYLAATANQSSEITLALKNLALKDLQKSYDLNPKNLATIRNNVPLYYFLASKDITKPAGPDNIEPLFLPVAAAFYSKTGNISPNDVGIYVLLAKYENRLGLKEELQQSLTKIKQLRPDLFGWNDSLKELRDLNVSF